MSEPALARFRYQPRFCRFLQKDVWAIERQQPDGTWQVINCLDKDTPCFEHECAFTDGDGTWPYEGAPKPAPTAGV